MAAKLTLWKPTLDLSHVHKMLDRQTVTIADLSYEIAVMAPPGHTEWFNSGSQHVALFARLNRPQSQMCHWVIFKFAIVKSDTSKLAYGRQTPEVHTISARDMKGMMNRYTSLRNFCVGFESVNSCTRKVRVNQPFIGNVGGVDVWVEGYVSNFRKFWGCASSQQVRMVTSASEMLSQLQYYIYLHSGQRYTVIDLQGEIQDDKYILCDVEFTNTLSSELLEVHLFNNYLNSSEFRDSKSKGLHPQESSQTTVISGWYSTLHSPGVAMSTEGVATSSDSDEALLGEFNTNEESDVDEEVGEDEEFDEAEESDVDEESEVSGESELDEEVDDEEVDDEEVDDEEVDDEEVDDEESNRLHMQT